MVKRVGNRHDNRSQGRAQDVEVPRATNPVEQALRVQPSHETGFVVREQLSSLISARRSPPALKVAKAAVANEAVSGEIAPESLGLLAELRSDVLAFHITELTMRLNKMEKEDLEPADLRAINSINQLLRMVEHLHVLQTTPVLQ